MNLARSITLVILAFFLTLLDTSFFSFLPVGDSTILSSFVTLITFALIGKTEELMILAPATVLAFAIFSSLPLWLIMIVFLFLPTIIVYLKKQYIPEPSLFVGLLIFTFSTFVFDFTVLLAVAGLNGDGIISMLSFILINSLFGLLIFRLMRLIRRRVGWGEIRL